MKITFGKFKGQEIENIPTSYLEWCLGNVIMEDKIQEEMEAQLKLRNGEGIPRDRNYIERHSMKFKEDKNE